MSCKGCFCFCFCFRRRFRLAATEAPPPIKALFIEYSDNGIMNADQLRRFLIEVQKQENATLEDAQEIMRSTAHLFHRKGFNIEAFFKYLFSDSNPPIDGSVHDDMNAPLPHYFIFTGYKSYLTGNQLGNDCSDVPIVQALRKGVRVIELDIWPNSTKDDVDVLHGRTTTTPVQLIKCLESIKDHAFTASKYPVVIILNDHLTTDLQAIVAEMVTKTFGDMLFTLNTKSLEEFPSPESLKRRIIIISTEPPKESLKSQETKASGNTSHKDNDDSEEEEEEEDDDHSTPEYRNLIAIHAGKGKGSLDDCLRLDPDKVKLLSLSEQKLEKAAKTHGPQIVWFTQRNILRVYPKGLSFDSSNYNPQIGWLHGAQMVTFNMQGDERSLWVMQGMFKANGGCGYVKKPDILIQNDSIFDPRVTLPLKIILKVTVFMGEGWYHDFSHTRIDAYSPPDFYIKVGIAGVPADTIMTRTNAIEGNWIPTWNEEFEFPLSVPELAILRIEVNEYDMSEKGDFGGQTCLPISELQKGIRAVPLYNPNGDKYNSVKLLMQFDFVRW